MLRRCGQRTKDAEYILPARFDETEIPGLRKTIGYVDLRRKSPGVLAVLILQKLGRPKIEFK